jgi:hypothetical protein
MRPGLTENSFRDLFTKCGVCSLVMAKYVYLFHKCGLKEEIEVVDLTHLESDEE